MKQQGSELQSYDVPFSLKVKLFNEVDIVFKTLARVGASYTVTVTHILSSTCLRKITTLPKIPELGIVPGPDPILYFPTNI